MKKLRGVLFILTFCFTVFFFQPVYSFSGLSYPDSATDQRELNISLWLGESWTDSKGKKYIGHLGEDYVGSVGKNVYAIADGVVEYSSGWPNCPLSKNHGWGAVLILKHNLPSGHYFSSEGTIITPGTEIKPNAIFAQYGHLQNLLVSPGDTVKKGQKIGEIGKVCPYIPHMHFEIKDSESINLDSNNGIGRGYSRIDGYAPNRYKPSEFIDLNKDLIVDEEESTDEEYQKEQVSSWWKKIRDKLWAWKLWKFFSRPEAKSDVIDTIDRLFPEVEEPVVSSIDDPPEVYDGVFSSELVTVAGSVSDVVHLSVQAVNTGDTVWNRSDVSLNVVGGRSKNALFYHESWITQLRPSRPERDEVTPGSEGTFSFSMTLPDNPGDYVFGLQLVHQEGNTFTQIGDDVLTVSVRVTSEKEEESDEPNITSNSPISDEPTRSQEVEATPEEPVGVSPVVDEPAVSEEEDPGIIDKVVDFIKRLTGGGGSSNGERNESEQVEQDTHVFEEQDDEVEVGVVSSSLALVFPTSTLVTTSSFFVVEGVAIGDVVEFVQLTGTTTSVPVVSSSWSFAVPLVVGTSTMSFVGLDAEGSIVTESVTTTIVREIVLPVIVPIPVPNPYEAVTSSTEILLSGAASSSLSAIEVLFGTTTVSSTTTDDRWSITLPLVEGENPFSLFGRTDDERYSASTSIVITRDTTAPIVSDVSVAHLPGFFSVSVSSSLTNRYDVEFLFLPGPGEVQTLCPDESSVFMPSTAGILTSFPDLLNVLFDTPCVWFQFSGASSTVSFSLAEQIQGIPVVARVRAFDDVGNVSDWFFSDVLFPEDIPQPTPEDDKLVISEIGWMGTLASSNDEWIELYNPGVSAVSLDGWELSWNTVSLDLSGITVGAGQYVVFERTASTTILDVEGVVYAGGLRNTGEHVQLFRGAELIDEVNASDGWFSGNNDTKESMVRISPVDSGSNTSNWCSYSSCPVTLYVEPNEVKHDADGNDILGSPGVVIEQILIPER